MKKYSNWLRIAATFQFLSAIAHSISLFVGWTPSNEKEENLLSMMHSYQFDLGSGIHRTMHELWIAMSSCFCLLYLFGALLNLYLLKKKTGHGLMRGVIMIQLAIFGAGFALMLRFTFIPPIVLTGLTFMAIVVAWMTVPKRSATS